MKNTQGDFYQSLGLLSIKFARLEYNVMEILSKFITDNSVISHILFERNSLDANMELLKQFNKVQEFEPMLIDNLIREIGNVRKRRNLFIHGLWSEPFEKDNDIVCFVGNNRMKYVAIENNKQWTIGKNTEIRLSYLKTLIRKIDHIIESQEAILWLMEDKGWEMRDH